MKLKKNATKVNIVTRECDVISLQFQYFFPTQTLILQWLQVEHKLYQIDTKLINTCFGDGNRKRCTFTGAVTMPNQEK